MRALTRILRTPLGITAVALLALVVLTAIFAPIIWGEQADVVDTDNMLARPSAEHPIGTDQLGRDLLLRVLVATRLSLVLALLATLVSVDAGLILGMAPLAARAVPGRGVTWLVGVAVAFPGLLLALFFAIIFGSRMGRRRARDRTGRRPALRAPLPDPRRRRHLARLRRRRAHRRHRPAPRADPPHPSQHRRAAHRQRHHRRRRRAARLRRALVHRHRRAAAGVRLGPPHDGGSPPHLHQPARRARARHRGRHRRPRLQPRRRSRGARLGIWASIPPRSARPSTKQRRGTRCRGDRSATPVDDDVVLEVANLRVTFPGAAGAVPPGARGELHRPPRRGRRHRGRIGFGQVRHGPVDRPARRGSRRRRGRRPCDFLGEDLRARRHGAGAASCSAPRWRWCSRTR